MSTTRKIALTSAAAHLVAMPAAYDHNCSVARTWLVTHGTMDLATGQTTEGEQECSTRTAAR